MDEDPRQTAYRAHRRAWAAATGRPYPKRRKRAPKAPAPPKAAAPVGDPDAGAPP